MASILIVLTSHTRLGDTGRRTGFHFEELATPYYAFAEAGHKVSIASITGSATHDPASLDTDESTRPASVRRFLGDPVAMAALDGGTAIDAVDAADYDVVFLPGGHGTMWDFPTSERLGAIVGSIHAAGGVVGSVCHGPAGLVNVRRADGRPLVEGLRVNSFTDAEEREVGLADTVPFLLESRLRALGGRFEGGPNFTVKAVSDERLVTGQNPMSSAKVAELVLEAVAVRDSVRA